MLESWFQLEKLKDVSWAHLWRPYVISVLFLSPLCLLTIRRQASLFPAIMLCLATEWSKSNRAKWLCIAMSCISHFLVPVTKYLIFFFKKKQFKGGRSYSDSSLTSIVHHGVEDMAAESSELESDGDSPSHLVIPENRQKNRNGVCYILQVSPPVVQFLHLGPTSQNSTISQSWGSSVQTHTL